MPAADSATRATAAGEYVADRLTRRAILGMQYDADLARRVVKMLGAVERDLVGQIAAIDPTGTTPTRRLVRLRKLLVETRQTIRQTYRRIALLTTRDLNKLTQIEAAATVRAINTGLATANISIAVNLPTPATFAMLAEENLVVGRPLAEWWSRAELDTIGAFAEQMRIGVIGGETVEQLARRIAGGERDGVKIKGVMDVSRRTARTLVRTSVASIQNNARQAVYEANLDVITEFVHLSRLDSRTSEICIARSGRRWDAETKLPIGHDMAFRTPPLHPNCRSVLVVKVLGGDPPEVSGADDWLKKIGPGEQDALLGKGKAQLYRDGKISAKDLIDQSDRPMPLAALDDSND